jgi:DNA gyrase subunit A
MSDENKIGKANKSNTIILPIQNEMKSSYLDYAMSVIIGRALPDVRDGLKPVHRRVLFSMHMLNNYHNRPYVKSARVVGDVIGKYHPHGDSSVYGTIVRMAQDFSLRYVLVDGQGNFGSIDGDNAAAMRYTEIRMDKLSTELLKDIDKETVNWNPNYDDSLKEPAVLPTKVPNLLINGSTGIAVGMSTNIPPHNLTEVVNGLITLIEKPETTIDELLKIIPGPDFPTGGIINGISGLIQAYKTGKGIIQVRGKVEIETNEKNGRDRIVITELPYQVLKSKLIEKIASLVNDKEIEGISDIRDESNRLGMRIVIELKKGEISKVTLNRLYKQTQLQISYGIIFLAIHKGYPKVLNLKDTLNYFIDHRRDIIVRRTIFDLKKAKEKAHILEGLKKAVENIDSIIELIKKSVNAEEAKKNLIIHYQLSDIQSQSILDMRLQRITGLEQKKILEDYENTLKEISKLEEVLNSSSLINKIILEECQNLIEQFGDKRKTEIIPDENEIFIEDLIKNESNFVTITKKGYIKRMGIDTYKSQKRGGKGVKGANLEEDYYTHLFTCDTHDNILFFTNKGTVFSMKVYQIPEGLRTSKGRNIANLLQMPENEHIKEIISIPEKRDDLFLIVATVNGTVKRSPLSEYKNIKQSGIKAIKVLETDEIIGVRISDGKKDVLLCSSSGKTIRFLETDCRAMGRVSQGVKGMELDESEKLVGIELIDDSVQILTISEKGFGKRTSSSEYRKQTRGGKGILAAKLTDKTGDIVKMLPVFDKDDLMIITDAGQVIRIKVCDISLIGRNTQGVRLINVKGSEKVVSVENLLESEESNPNSESSDVDTESNLENEEN